MRGPFATSGFALMFRWLRRRFGVAAPRVAVRVQLPWYWRASMTALLLIAVLVLAGWMYDAGSRLAGYNRQETGEELAALRLENARQMSELERLRREVGAGEGNVQMARAAQERLVQQVKDLESENNRLREDLAVFENLAKERSQPVVSGVRK
ncbi:conserved protein of unknown function [Denitratisoma oestradiolicum]|uniref:Uncharacterized protein n=2 Tax=Denitratisoma oestradiolicum TaxID=311182 RepID=A0A6S6Y4I3_9PROT|nr:conserved protein of unknown function [Denitratisoma oestradiolicum]